MLMSSILYWSNITLSKFCLVFIRTIISAGSNFERFQSLHKIGPINLPISISSVCVIFDLIESRYVHFDTFSGVATSSFSIGCAFSLNKLLKVKSNHSSCLHQQPSSYLPSRFLLISLQ